MTDSGASSTPFVVYFSSTTEMTRRFVEKVGIENARIPLRSGDGQLLMDRDYVIVVPTYGGGHEGGAVPKQVIKFLNVEQNRNHCIAVIASGNINFGEAYLLAGKIVSEKLGVPFVYGFELLGLPEDVRNVREGIEKEWANLVRSRHSQLTASTGSGD